MKRHLLTAGGGLLAIFLTIALLEGGESIIQGRQSATAPEFTLETPDPSDVPDLADESLGSSEADAEGTMPAGPAEKTKGELDDKVVRDIAPEQFGLPQDITAKPLTRIEARQPLSEPLPKPEPVPSVLRHPVALSAGLIRFDGGRLLQLEGLLPQTAERTCGDTGKGWPCGAVARTAFRNFLRARALVCNVPKTGWQGTLTATCTINAIDPALWLAENGWADAVAGSPLEDAVETAQKSRLGFFGNDPRGARPMLPDEAAMPGSTEAAADTPDPDL